jgi:hypothetical protein
MGMAQTPLLLPTVIVLAVAAVEWKASRAVAWAALVAGCVLMTAVIRYPALSIADVVDAVAPGFAALLLVARVVGAACFMWCVVRTIRAAGIPW